VSEGGAVDANGSHSCNGGGADGVRMRPREVANARVRMSCVFPVEVCLSGTCQAINEGQPLNCSQG